MQEGPLTDSAFDYLSYALAVANHLTVIKSPISSFKYDVIKENEEKSKCTVIICPFEEPNCSCKFHHDCGMVCVHLLAVASKFKIDWSRWIHPRYFVSSYRLRSQNVISYPDFNSIVQTNDDIPTIIASLKQRQNRIGSYGDIHSHHKH